MKYIAALYTNEGNLVTGANHGEAFGKVSIEEQSGDLISGFVDPETGEFISGENKFYLKKILLVRHAQVEGDEHDPKLSEAGRSQGKKASSFFSENIEDLDQYRGFSSPLQRCVETSSIISKNTNLNFETNERFSDPLEQETPKDFLIRLRSVLHHLPEKSIIVSHCKFILNLAQIAVENSDFSKCCGLPNLSVTYVNHKELKWLGKKTF